MAANDSVRMLFPVGRYVGGSPSVAQIQYENDGKTPKKDAEGKDRKAFWMAVAIKKEPGHTSWTQTAWGTQLWQIATKAWPQGQYRAVDFAWKVQDGDDATITAKRPKPLNSREGYPGHWIINFGNGFQPKLVNRDGSQEMEAAAFQGGNFVQVLADVSGNGSQSAGMYLNFVAVAHSGYDGVTINLGSPSVDTTSVGFGSEPLPAGVSTVPVGQMPGSAVPAPAGSGVGIAPPAQNTAAVAPPNAVLPPADQNFTAGAAALAGVTAPPPNVAAPLAPPPPAVKVVDGDTSGQMYAAHIAAGWTDAQLIAAGKMKA